ncbi:MAG: HDOD domain-containing protein [Candidatus Nitrotoga sp. MKT]|nr:MAG: HDOD domain-containing protein [Candidatus Nitrotoga sp. MKT]
MSGTQQNSRPAPVDSLFESAILDIGIPPCPAVLDRFMAEMGKDEPDFKRLADIIGADVALSAGLIKTANSPYSGMRQRVRSANEALTMLGLKASSHIVAGIILRKSFPNVRNLERFWDASARIARLSAWLAQELKLRGLHVNDAYTFGLFRDCGIPVLLGYFPEYGKALAEANSDSERCFIEVEETEIPTNHAMIGHILAQSWWLPEELCLGIRNHHELAKIESAHSDLPIMSRRLIATSQLAEHLVQKKLGLSMTQEWTKLGVACLRLLEVDEERLEILYAEAPITKAVD